MLAVAKLTCSEVALVEGGFTCSEGGLVVTSWPEHTARDANVENRKDTVLILARMDE